MTGGEGGLCPPSFDPAATFFESGEGRALIQRLLSLSGPRVIIAVVGPPGSGKSTLAASLVARLDRAALVPMDGFHLDDRILDARGLRDRKGAVETFDASGFAALASRMAVPGSEVFYPVFDRSREIAIAGAGVVRDTDRVIVIEGNYLLLDQSPWNRVEYDLTVSLNVPEDELRRRLTQRWQGLGKSPDAVAAHLENDLRNARLVAAQSRAADVTLVGQKAHHEPGEA